MKKTTILLLLIAVILSGCKDKNAKKNEPVNAGFTDYITGFTNGEISVIDPITIQLNHEIDSATLSQEPDSKLFSFSPSIKGKAVWVNAFTLEFRPESALKNNTKYTGTFQLGKLEQVPDEYNSFPLHFSTKKQDATITEAKLVAAGTEAIHAYTVEGTLKTADYLSDDDVEKLINIKIDDAAVKVNWEHNSDNQHRFYTDKIERSEQNKTVEVSLQGKSINIDRSDSRVFQIPQKSEFTILHAELKFTPSPCIEVTFSDNLNTNSNIVLNRTKLGNNTPISVSISNNIATITPTKSLVGSQVLRISKGIASSINKTTKDDFTQYIIFSREKPEVALIGKGTILPSSAEGLIVPFKAVSLNAVDVRIIKIFQSNIGQFLQVNALDETKELVRVGKTVLFKKIPLELMEGESATWKNFSLDLSKLIAVDPGAIYRVELSFRKEYYDGAQDTTYADDESTSDNKTMEQYNTDETSIKSDETSSWDYYDESGDESSNDGTDIDNPNTNAYYNLNRWSSRNILATNLGIIAKKGAGKEFDVMVNDLRTTQPVSGALIEVYNLQLQKIGEAKTGDRGSVRLTYNGVPFYLVASRDKERTYMKVADQNALSVSTFDVSGSIIQQGLKGYIYGDRGVWRPGDTLNISFMLEDRNNTLPLGHPITFELRDPQGRLVKRMMRKIDDTNLYTFPVSTNIAAPTGTYNITIGVGGVNFYEKAKIETIKPNRLKIKLTFPEEKLTKETSSMNGSLEVKWLQGSVARDLDAKVSVYFKSVPTNFPRYKDYTFSNPANEYQAGDPQELFDGTIDNDGKATIPFDINLDDATPPGMLEANITTRVFERGGDFSINQMSIPYAPYKVFVGLRTPKTDEKGMVLTDTTHYADIVTVNSDGNPIPHQEVEATLYQVAWRWWWDASSKTDGLYSSSSSRSKILSSTITTNSVGAGKFKFRVNYPSWGRYFIELKTKEGHTAGKVIYIDWPGWAKRISDDNTGTGASMLMFTSDKPKYNVGEKAVLTIPTSEGGRALISIENSSKVLQSYWVETTKDQTVFNLDITKDMTPNVYVNVTLLQPHAQTKNDLPIRMYGIIPLKVEDSETILKPQIITADEYRAAKEIEVSVKEEKGRSMYYTLAIVDEGILDLTNFATPSPWDKFYVRESLGVRTWDMYDQVIGAFGGRIESLFAIGGGGQGADNKQKEVNRFKPVVKFLGPFELKSGATNTHKVTLPMYIGSVRVMVVAKNNDGAYGSTEKAVPVKDPLMLLATMPRVLGPSDKVKLPVTVFCMDDKIKKVNVKVEYQSLLKAAGSQEETLTFDKQGEQDVVFDAEALNKLGIARVKVTATGGGETATQTIELNVRSSNPVISDGKMWVLKGNESLSDVYKPLGIEGTNTFTLEYSTLPPLNIGKRLNYLIQYPHGCIEQTTSSVFPQLYIAKVVDISDEQKHNITKNITAGIQRLMSFQTSEGGFSYWPGENTVCGWGTNYAGNFMLEAEKQGYQVPTSLKRGWEDYQKTTAQACSPNLENATEQAYRLYTLALDGKPELAAMNRLRDYIKTHAVNKVTTWQLADAFVMAGQKEVALNLLDMTKLALDPNQKRELSNTYGSYWRDEAKLLALLTHLNKGVEAINLAKSISDQLNKNTWMSTQETAYALMSMCEFTANNSNNKVDVSVKVTSAGKTTFNDRLQSKFSSKVQEFNPAESNFTVTNNNTSPVYVVLSRTGSPLQNNEVSDSKTLSMKIQYLDMDNDVIDVTKLAQGTDFKARVTVSNTYGVYSTIPNIALTQIFPAGWEITNTRLYDGAEKTDESAYDHKDIRDDRVMTYFGLDGSQSKTFEVYLTAAYVGSYYLSAVHCEAMYDNMIYATEKGQEVEVVK